MDIIKGAKEINDISERILLLMNKFGYTTYRIAKISGVYVSTIDAALHKKNSWASARNLYRISRALNISMEYLITGDINKREMEFNSAKETKLLKEKIIELETKLKEKENILNNIKSFI